MKLAIVEDDSAQARTLAAYCEKYGAEKGADISAVHFDEPSGFLEKYRGGFDAVFMDIVMPVMDGMECARRLRKIDEDVVLCFVTTMAQYAVKGYEVGAFDFIIKPVSYGEFAMKLDRIARLLSKRRSEAVMIVSRSAVRRVEVKDLMYVEVYDHMLIYHTRDGDIEAHGKLAALEQDEKFRRFLKVSPSHLVSCDHITSVAEDHMTVGGNRIPISRRRRKECLEKMAELLGGGLF